MVKKGEERKITEEEENEEKALERQQQIRALQRKEAITSYPQNNSPPPPPPYTKPTFNAFEATAKSWQINNIGGPSQTVIYTSKFVDRLSEVTKDLAVSASLSIKAGTVAGGGRGSFIDVDKFLDADLNYYLSVKVTNQSINFKDPLEFNPLPLNAGINSTNFLQTYGDCFINGFQEGGEFNAIVSMKILNQAKSLDIQAAAKVAFNSGALGVEASAAFGLAKANITLNTSTTIVATWSGGGNIKPPNEPWTIDSLIRAAARFPENVAKSPQRTYATLMKYETLRSYLALKPLDLSPASYDHVITYTDELMENFMAYKCLAKQIQEDIRDIHDGQKRFGKKTKDDDDDDEKTNFHPSIDGLQAACRSIRHQLSGIVSRVEFLTERPDFLMIDHPDFIQNKKTKIDPGENFQSYAVFWSRLPRIESVKTGKANTPLTGMRITSNANENDNKSKDSRADDSLIQHLCELEPSSLGLLESEEKKILLCLALHSTIHENIRLTRPIGSRNDGKLFHSLDFLRLVNTDQIFLCSISVGMSFSRITSICLQYSNGLQWRRGSREANQTIFILDHLGKEDFITSGKIRCGKPGNLKTIKDAAIVELDLYTNTGRSLEARPKVERRFGYKTKYLDERLFSRIEEQTFNCPLNKGRLIGINGLSREDAVLGGIYRLGFVWQNDAKKNTIEKEEEGKEKSTTTELNKMTICEPLHSAMNPADLIDEISQNQLSEKEQASLSSIEARKRFVGLLFGPLLHGSTPSGPEKGHGKAFNDVEYLQTSNPLGDSWPSRLQFRFRSNNDFLNLVAVSITYGRHTILHGSEIILASDKILSVTIDANSFITKIQVQASENASVSTMPSNLLITVAERKPTFHTESAKKEESKIKTLTLDQTENKTFKIAQTLTGSEKMPGLKGFFGCESETDIIRLLPIWSST